MPDVKISALPAAGALSGTEPVPIVQSADTKITTCQDIANLAPGAASAFPVPAAGTVAFQTTTGPVTLALWKDNGGIDLLFEKGASSWQVASGGVAQGGFAFNVPVSYWHCSNNLAFTFDTSAAGAFTVDGNFNTLSFSGFTTTYMQVTGLAGGNWGGVGTPPDVGTAIDRLATAVAGLLGGAIP